MVKKMIKKNEMNEDYCDLYGCEGGFFTRDDLNELMADINDKCPKGLEAVEAYMSDDDKTLEVVFNWDEYGQDSVYKKIDYRAIRRPSDILKFTDELIQMGKDKLGYISDEYMHHLDWYAGITDESLEEDIAHGTYDEETLQLLYQVGEEMDPYDWPYANYEEFACDHPFNPKDDIEQLEDILSELSYDEESKKWNGKLIELCNQAITTLRKYADESLKESDFVFNPNPTSNKKEINLPGYAVQYDDGYAGWGVNHTGVEYFRTEKEQKEFADKLKSKHATGIKTYKVDDFYHTEKDESLKEGKEAVQSDVDKEVSALKGRLYQLRRGEYFGDDPERNAKEKARIMDRLSELGCEDWYDDYNYEESLKESADPEWRAICREYCRQNGYTLLFVNEDSFGYEDKNGHMIHKYVDELVHEFGGRYEESLKESYPVYKGLETLEQLASDIESAYNGAEWRGAPKPKADPGCINEINLPDNCRLKSLDAVVINEGGDVGIDVEYITQEPFKGSEGEQVVEEIAKAIEYMTQCDVDIDAEDVGDNDVTVIVEVICREGKDYGYVVMDLVIRDFIEPTNESLKESDNEVTDEFIKFLEEEFKVNDPDHLGDPQAIPKFDPSAINTYEFNYDEYEPLTPKDEPGTSAGPNTFWIDWRACHEWERGAIRGMKKEIKRWVKYLLDAYKPDYGTPDPIEINVQVVDNDYGKEARFSFTTDSLKDESLKESKDITDIDAAYETYPLHATTDYFYGSVEDVDKETLQTFEDLGFVNDNSLIIPAGTVLRYTGFDGSNCFSFEVGNTGHEIWFIDDAVEDDFKDWVEILKEESLESLKESTDDLTRTVGIYGDEVKGFDSVEEIVNYFKKKGIKVYNVFGDMESGWEMDLKGPAKKLFFAVCNVIPGYNCNSVDEFIDKYEYDED